MEVVDEVLLPEPVKANPELWKEISREENKRLDYQPAKFFWRRTIRPKFVHRFNREAPPVIAAAHLKVPTLIHEANAVLGRANRLLSKFVDQIAMGFGEARTISGKKIAITGNPVRPAVLKASKRAYTKRWRL